MRIRIYKISPIFLLPIGFMSWIQSAWAAGGAETALDLLDSPVAYTATYRASDGKGVYTGKVWHEPGRERRDFETNGGGQAVLLRRDMDAAYLVKPSGKWYVAVGFHAALSLAGGLDGLTVIRKKIGPETVEGHQTTHFHIVADTVEGTETEPGGKKVQVTLIQSNISIGAVEDGRLDVPQGYMGINLKTVTPENLAQAIQSITPLLGGKK